MNRRELLGLAGAAAVSPRLALGQRPKVPRIVRRSRARSAVLWSRGRCDRPAAIGGPQNTALRSGTWPAADGPRPSSRSPSPSRNRSCRPPWAN